jgi:hypothetical protein
MPPEWWDPGTEQCHRLHLTALQTVDELFTTANIDYWLCGGTVSDAKDGVWACADVPSSCGVQDGSPSNMVVEVR